MTEDARVKRCELRSAREKSRVVVALGTSGSDPELPRSTLQGIFRGIRPPHFDVKKKKKVDLSNYLLGPGLLSVVSIYSLLTVRYRRNSHLQPKNSYRLWCPCTDLDKVFSGQSPSSTFAFKYAMDSFVLHSRRC